MICGNVIMSMLNNWALLLLHCTRDAGLLNTLIRTKKTLFTSTVGGGTWNVLRCGTDQYTV